MKRLLAVGLVLLALSSCAGISLGEPPSYMGENPHSISTAQDFDGVQFRITAYENGSARWTFQYQRTLANSTERQQFQEFAAHFDGNDTQLYDDFRGQARRLASAGTTATGRNMEAVNFRKDAEIGGLDGNLGIVRMSFVWTNFAVQQDGRLIIGDVFEGGLYIGPNQSLVVEVGDGIGFVEALPEPDSISLPESLQKSESVTWDGEQEFADRRPHVVFEPREESTPTTGGATPTTSPTPVTENSTTVGPGNSGTDGWMMFGVAFLLFVGLAAGLLWYGSPDFDSFPSGLFPSDDDGTDGGAEVSEKPSPPSVSEEELLTDETRVLQLLENNGGRMKQVNIVEETGWSKSKVSMLLSEMAEEEEINKLRMGRENIISLDGHEPDAARSPFEEN